MNDHADRDDGDPNQSPAHGDTDQSPAQDDHLADVEPGAGCTEIWEYLSERRNDASDAHTEE